MYLLKRIHMSGNLNSVEFLEPLVFLWGYSKLTRVRGFVLKEFFGCVSDCPPQS